jgi:hypothetical protein
MNLKRLSVSIYTWLLSIAGLIALLAEAYRRLGQSGALENEAWFIHAVTSTVNQLSQQRKRQVDGAVRVVTGVKGKTYPFNRIGSQDMVQITTRDAQTVYSNPPQSKRRAHLYDYAQAVLIDDFDEIKMLANPVSELSQILAFGLERKYDDLVLSQPFTGVGGFLGTAETVDEGAETVSATSLPAAQKIANGGTGLTMAKIRQSKRIMGEASVIPEDQYFFYSPKGMEQLLADPTATSADYSTLNALTSGTFPMDATWYGAKWRESVKLPKAANIRTCVREQKSGTGLAIGLVKNVELGRDPSHWNNAFAMLKLSGGSVRVDDTCVVAIDIDESV